MLSIHEIRGPSAERKRLDSAFLIREPHYMLEIFPAGKSLSSKDVDKGAQELYQAMLTHPIE
jgi:hypothetical protein